ncbi:MAG: hypothetical protein LBG15_13055 [Dysgonamonadaceae bacterium]|nr:hypothetical protein [Dysgonamonadaceae bacterium]
MKQKMIYLALTLWTMSAASVNAQVTIGTDADPDPSAILDLNTTDKGLLLPRIALLSTGKAFPLISHVEGMTVYNTAVSGYGTTAVTPGIYFNNGSKWVRMGEEIASNAPKIETQPERFTFSRLQDNNGDPNGPASFSTTLTISATGSNLKYQWYQKPKNTNGKGIAIDGATNASYTVEISSPGLANWGLYSYYCVVSNSYGSVYSNPAEVALGCGAKSGNVGWRSFMCFNLGADTSLDPFTYTSIDDTTSHDSKGWIFQWGRIADGHQWRSAPKTTSTDAYSGPFDGNGQIPPTETDYYGKVINSGNNQGNNNYDWRFPHDDTLWGELKTNADPCPSGWRVPSLREMNSCLGFGNLHIGNLYGIRHHSDKVTFGFNNNGSDIVTLLFGFAYNGNLGYYWESTGDAPVPVRSYMLTLSSGSYNATAYSGRSSRYSVRCIND